MLTRPPKTPKRTKEKEEGNMYDANEEKGEGSQRDFRHTIVCDFIVSNREGIAISSQYITISCRLIVSPRRFITISREPITINRELITINRELITINRELITISRELITISRELITISCGIIAIIRSLKPITLCVLSLFTFICVYPCSSVVALLFLVFIPYLATAGNRFILRLNRRFRP
jgi:hypothetical protein